MQLAEYVFPAVAAVGSVAVAWACGRQRQRLVGNNRVRRKLVLQDVCADNSCVGHANDDGGSTETDATEGLAGASAGAPVHCRGIASAEAVRSRQLCRDGLQRLTRQFLDICGRDDRGCYSASPEHGELTSQFQLDGGDSDDDDCFTSDAALEAMFSFDLEQIEPQCDTDVPHLFDHESVAEALRNQADVADLENIIASSLVNDPPTVRQPVPKHEMQTPRSAMGDLSKLMTPGRMTPTTAEECITDGDALTAAKDLDERDILTHRRWTREGPSLWLDGLVFTGYVCFPVIFMSCKGYTPSNARVSFSVRFVFLFLFCICRAGCTLSFTVV